MFSRTQPRVYQLTCEQHQHTSYDSSVHGNRCAYVDVISRTSRSEVVRSEVVRLEFRNVIEIFNHFDEVRYKAIRCRGVVFHTLLINYCGGICLV